MHGCGFLSSPTSVLVRLAMGIYHAHLDFICCFVVGSAGGAWIAKWALCIILSSLNWFLKS